MCGGACSAMQTYDAFFVLSVIYLNRMKGKGTQLSHCFGTAAPDIRKELMREIESQRRSPSAAGRHPH
ncbi:unnamed protein product [Musa banksii]